MTGVVLPGNGDQHAVEIASMSLDLLNKTAAFVIPHIPARRVQLRIGIHTGTQAQACYIVVSQAAAAADPRYRSALYSVCARLCVLSKHLTSSVDVSWKTKKRSCHNYSVDVM